MTPFVTCNVLDTAECKDKVRTVPATELSNTVMTPRTLWKSVPTFSNFKCAQSIHVESRTSVTIKNVNLVADFAFHLKLLLA